MTHPFRAITLIATLAVIGIAATGTAYGSSAPTVDASADCTAMTVTATNTANQPVVVTLDGGPPTAVAPGVTKTWGGLSYGPHTVTWSYENGATGSKAVSHHNPPDCAPPASPPPAATVPSGPPAEAPPAVTPDAPLVSAPGAPTQLPATGAGVNWTLAIAVCLLAGGTVLVKAGVRRP